MPEIVVDFVSPNNGEGSERFNAIGTRVLPEVPAKGNLVWMSGDKFYRVQEIIITGTGYLAVCAPDVVRFTF